ncbi:MAG: AAA domain-containing protein [Cytophagales bacterium]|nr:AAA domain-containing protein [Cytophagales bacterium]MDW8384892.1 AAA domain-containing protein [Flammeovirgaceae bacterium]
MEAFIQSYFEKLQTLLEEERKEEIRLYEEIILKAPISERREQGWTWYPVQIVQQDFINQSVVLTFERTTHLDLPTRWQVGNVLTLFSNQQNGRHSETISGIILSLWKERVKVQFPFDEIPEWIEEGKLGLDMAIDNISYQEMEKAIRIVSEAHHNRLEKLRNILLGLQKVSFDTTKFVPELPLLNTSQQKAVEIAMRANEIAIVHGPPGTGKTTTLCQLIRLLVQEKKQVLVSAPSNTAVDVLTERLGDMGLKVLRIGHPSRIQETLLRYSLDYQISVHPDTKLIKKWRQQADEYQKLAYKYKRNFGENEYQQRKLLLEEARKLRKDAQQQEKNIIDELIAKAQVITATLVGSANPVLENKQFACALIDEAAQALEPACWIPILKAEKVIFAGDHHQLPPTIKSINAAQQGLSVTLFEKAIQKQAESSQMLSIQYRANSKIMEFSSRRFYQSQLRAHETVAHLQLFAEGHPENSPITWIDTAGCGFEEQYTNDTKSYFNPKEAHLLHQHLQQLIQQLSSRSISIAVISPYKKQVEYFSEILTKEIQSYSLEINTIDGFQGQEKDVIYISLVRSNTDGKIGFLEDIRRMNVAITRARYKLIIVGDSATVGNHSFYRDLLEYIQKEGDYKSAWELEYFNA